MRMSLNQYYRAKTLASRGLIKVTSENDSAIWFRTKYKDKEYEIIYEKRNDRWNCTCEGFSVWLKGNDCVHIKGAKLLEVM